MDALPTLFLSHGAPDLPLRQGAVNTFLGSLATQLPPPQAILVISAHWHSQVPTVSRVDHPQTLYDFGGFPQALYQLRYAAPGAPALAERVVELLHDHGIPAQTDDSRGLDHGAWTPLIVAYPQATIPVTQLSIHYGRDPEYHWQVGQALQALRHEGVLVIGSGSMTHNLSAFSPIYDAAPPEWVQAFDQWALETIQRGDWGSLKRFRQTAPYARQNHPTPEHLWPLFVAIAAAGPGAVGIPLHRSYTYGAFSMAAYAFSSPTL
ncbi:MAG: class III extradiol ring-cleavage dioxygenase [Synechococcales cyanobacterium]